MKYSLFFFKKPLMQNITIEQLEQLHEERNEVMASQAFQDWYKSLNVGRLYISKESFYNAREMNGSYDFKKLNWLGKAK
jgi:hypothetical protein